jgi:hypothetical protein
MFCAQFGGLTWRMVPADARAAAQVWDSYSPYEVSGPAAEIECHVASGHPVAQPTDPMLHVRRLGSLRYVWRGDFSGEVDVEAGQVWFHYSGQIPSLHEFLRVANALLLSAREGVLLNASAIVRAGRAFLFPGPAGAGKTTIARLSGDVVLADQVSAVRMDGGQFHCFATPFFGGYAGPSAPSASAPLAKICFPLKDDHDEVAPVSSAAAVQQIVRSVFHHGADSDLTLRILDTCAALATHIPCSWLHFRPEPSFWSLVDG